ncbi:specificity protein transcription factor 3-like [Daphnia carinata]|uniref:specificity protein transcription factor 3-like n=1 Tax=Daphnia carinata TaxID=120202 RepID=UPI002869682E|nr:specificity protein transcription factor 3-like [Daphnia carinata]
MQLQPDSLMQIFVGAGEIAVPRGAECPLLQPLYEPFQMLKLQNTPEQQQQQQQQGFQQPSSLEPLGPRARKPLPRMSEFHQQQQEHGFVGNGNDNQSLSPNNQGQFGGQQQSTMQQPLQQQQQIKNTPPPTTTPLPPENPVRRVFRRLRLPNGILDHQPMRTDKKLRPSPFERPNPK